jgi:hypothetical protein
MFILLIKNLIFFLTYFNFFRKIIFSNIIFDNYFDNILNGFRIFKNYLFNLLIHLIDIANF